MGAEGREDCWEREVVNVAFGFKVTIRFTTDSPHWINRQGKPQELRNVTEVHYKYDKVVLNERIAFESGIHQTGATYALIDIAEFKTVQETEKAKDF